MTTTSSEYRPVIYFATNHDWGSYQHFYQGLALAFAATRPLLYVGSVVTGAQNLQADLNQVADNVWSLNVRVPKGAGRHVLRPLRDRLIARAVRRAVKRLGWETPPLVWTYTTDAAPYLRRAPDSPSVYWTGDDVVDKFEPALLRAVKHVFTVSPAATAKKRKLVDPSKVVEMPIATDPLRYESAAREKRVPRDLATLPRPWFGYGGAVNRRTDWQLMRALAAATSGTVVVVGPPNDDEGRRQTSSQDKPPNVVFLGQRNAEQAPHYLAAFDVGLIPYVLSEFNLGSNPVKTYDYLAAGRPVVATNLPALYPLAPHVAIAKTDNQFIQMALDAANQTGGEAERQAVANRYSYDVLVARIDEVLGTATRLP
mgnify:CR=1 FL=1